MVASDDVVQDEKSLKRSKSEISEKVMKQKGKYEKGEYLIK